MLNPTFAGGLVRAGVGPQPTRGRGEERTAAAPAPPQGGLTPREREVAELIARGRSNKLIALELGIAEKTVKTHVGNILGKLGLSDRTQAALYAVREGLV